VVPISARPLLVPLATTAALVLGGCGGHGQPHVSARARPALPHALARQLAAESDDIVRGLTAGDDCAALSAAMRLRRQTKQAIDAGRVPAVLRQQLESTAADLANRIHCVPRITTAPRAEPSPPPKKHGHENHGKHKGQGKHKGDNGDGGD
jgi:hypothetical protein